MAAKAVISAVILISAALAGCTELNAVPVADTTLENDSILSHKTELGIPVTPAIIVGVYQFTDQTG
jgi:hypothetical protein